MTVLVALQYKVYLQFEAISSGLYKVMDGLKTDKTCVNVKGLFEKIKRIKEWNDLQIDSVVTWTSILSSSKARWVANY